MYTPNRQEQAWLSTIKATLCGECWPHVEVLLFAALQTKRERSELRRHLREREAELAAQRKYGNATGKDGAQ